jgi:GST-like protein
MTYVSAAIYALAWIKDDPMRIAATKEDAPGVIDRVHDRIAYCWRKMDEQITPGRYILGDELSVLDLYVTVISRFGPWRMRLQERAEDGRNRPPRRCRPPSRGILGEAVSI